MKRRTFLLSSAAAMIFASMGAPAFAASPIYTGRIKGVALGGYDAVAYFTQKAAVKGDKQFAASFMGATWWFSSEANMKMFEASPKKYAPQYGGYCAYAAAKGALATGDPEAWTVYNGKLYINFSKSVRDIWSQDIPGNVAKADANIANLIANWPDP